MVLVVEADADDLRRRYRGQQMMRVARDLIPGLVAVEEVTLEQPPRSAVDRLDDVARRPLIVDAKESLHLFSRGFAPRTPLHALSRAASPARSVRVARFAALARIFYSSPIAFANTSSSVGTLGLRCRTWTPNCAAALKIALWSPTAAVTKTRITSSSVEWDSIPAFARTSRNPRRSPLIRNSYTRPVGPFSSLMGPWVATWPLSMTTT